MSLIVLRGGCALLDASILPGKVARDFPVLQRDLDGNRVIYLDNAATSLTPQPVIEAVSGYYRDASANIHRGKHALSEEASTRYEDARTRVATFVGAQAREVVFTKNTTEAVNIVAGGLGLASDDVVVVGGEAHHSALLPWRDRCRVQQVPVDGDGCLDLEALTQAFQREPAVVVLTACSNVTGVHLPVEQLVKDARDAGAVVVVDAAQSAPHRRLDVSALGADFTAFSGHKMLGPTGIGVLHGRAEALERLSPAALGGGVVDWVDSDTYRLRKLPHRFEAGTPDIAAAYGMAAAVGYLEAIGMDVVEEHDRVLATHLLDAAAERSYVVPLGGNCREDRSAILSLSIRNCPNLGEVARILSDSYGVMCRSGHLCAQPLVDRVATGQVLRISGYLYNTPEDIDTTFRALDETYRILGVA